MRKLLALVVLAAFMSGCIGQPAAPAETPNVTQETVEEPEPETGLFTLYMKDTIQNLLGYGKATGLNLTIEEAYIYSSDWVPLVTEEQKFDVIGLGEVEKQTVFSGQVPEGSYTKVKIVLGDGDIKIYNYNMYVWNKTYPLHPDPKEVEVAANIDVESGKEASLTLDLDVPNSVSKLPCDTGLCWYLNPLFYVIS